MYYCYGFPKVLDASLGPNSSTDDWVFVKQDQQYLVAVSETCVQLWSAGLNKLRLCSIPRTRQSLEQDGRHLDAFLCSSKGLLAVLVMHRC